MDYLESINLSVVWWIHHFDGKISLTITFILLMILIYILIALKAEQSRATGSMLFGMMALFSLMLLRITLNYGYWEENPKYVQAYLQKYESEQLHILQVKTVYQPVSICYHNFNQAQSSFEQHMKSCLEQFKN